MMLGVSADSLGSHAGGVFKSSFHLNRISGPQTTVKPDMDYNHHISGNSGGMGDNLMPFTAVGSSFHLMRLNRMSGGSMRSNRSSAGL